MNTVNTTKKAVTPKLKTRIRVVDAAKPSASRLPDISEVVMIDSQKAKGLLMACAERGIHEKLLDSHRQLLIPQLLALGLPALGELVSIRVLELNRLVISSTDAFVGINFKRVSTGDIVYPVNTSSAARLVYNQAMEIKEHSDMPDAEMSVSDGEDSLESACRESQNKPFDLYEARKNLRLKHAYEMYGQIVDYTFIHSDNADQVCMYIHLLLNPFHIADVHRFAAIPFILDKTTVYDVTLSDSDLKILSSQDTVASFQDHSVYTNPKEV